MVSGGRRVDLGSRIHHAMVFLCSAVSSRWQVAAHTGLRRPCIRLNKVCIWSLRLGSVDQAQLDFAVLLVEAELPWREPKAKTVRTPTNSLNKVRVVPLVRHHCYPLRLPPRVRGRRSGSEDELLFMVWCWRALAALVLLFALASFFSLSSKVLMGKEAIRSDAELEWIRSSRTFSSRSFSSMSFRKTLKPLAKMALFMPVSSGEISTSVGRPFWSLGVECFIRPEASGSVPVFDHGCNALSSLLRSGEEDGLNCSFKSFSKIHVQMKHQLLTEEQAHCPSAQPVGSTDDELPGSLAAPASRCSLSSDIAQGPHRLAYQVSPCPGR